MLLKSLEIQGFKSFPDKTVLKFGNGITAVVGPNGSGKSNISDAVRWVLGEQSIKTLRGGRMEDVIFNGAQSRRASGYAEVSITIDNAGREFASDADEITVTRRYYRSGESEYLINRAEVRLRDINEIFMDTGLGRGGYSIIGQGRIAEIVGAKSDERRRIFEEAAGISKFRYKKEESEKRLAEAEDNLLRLNDILTELAARLGPLKIQAEKAKKYTGLAAEKKELEVGLWVRSLGEDRAAVKENEQKYLATLAQYNEAEKSAAENEKQTDELYLQSQKKAAEAEDVRKAAEVMRQQALKKLSSADLLQNDIAHNSENAARLRGDIARCGELGEKGRGEIEEVNAKLAQKLKELGDANEQIDTARRELDEAAAQNKGYSAEIERFTARLAEIAGESSKAQLKRMAAVSDISHLQELAASAGRDAKLREEALENAQAKLAKKKGGAAAVDEKLASLGNEAAGYALKLKNRREKLAAAAKAEQEGTLRLSAARQRAQMLADMEKRLEGFYNSVKNVMAEKQRGGLRGIRGPVSTLLRVPAEYSLAVETALGGALQHIVVDDEEAAKAAIRFLKRTDGGRATFLPLSSVAGREDVGFKKGVGFVGMAAALIEYDPVYRGIVQNLLGRTAVAENLDAAAALARENAFRYKVVTLDGQVVNPGGSMTGGSSGRGPGLLSRAADIGRLTKEAEAMKTRVAEFAEQKKREEEAVAKVEADVSGLNAAISTAREEKIRFESEIKALETAAALAQSDLDAVRSGNAGRAERKKALESDLSEAEKRIRQAEEEAEKVKAAVKASGDGGRKTAALVQEKTAALSSLQLSAMEARKDCEALETAAENLKNSLDDSGRRARELQAEFEELQNRSAEAARSIEALKAEAEKLTAEADKSAAKIEALSAERMELERRTSELRQQGRGLSAERENLSREMARLEERKNSAQAEFDTVAGRLWDEYGLTLSEAEKNCAAVSDTIAAKKRIAELKSSIKSLGDVNVGAVDEYNEVSERHGFLSAQVGDVQKSKDGLKSLINSLTSSMRDIFQKQFKLITLHFEHIFVELFGGGSATLRLSDPADVLGSGIEIEVQPPGKIIKNLAALSGGEQAFVAIALYFAILKVRPSPFCILDEIEAALDDANVDRFAAYLRRMCDNTQFIVVTHRRGTMDEADVLYGVTMQDEGVSKLLTLEASQLGEKAG